MIAKVLGGGLAVAGLLAAVLGWRLLAAQEALGESRQALDQATLANQVNQETIDTVTMTLESCIADRAVDEQQNAIVVVELEARAIELEARSQRVRVVREEIFRDPTCEELGGLDIGLLCPAWAVSLRERATALSTN